MSNGATHKVASGAGIFITAALQEYLDTGKISSKSFVAGGLAAATGRLPDIIEPATSPNHRQFFHSLTFAVGLGFGMYKLYEWETEEDWQELLRFSGLVIGGSYLIHLLCDAGTPRGLPIV